MKTYKSRLLTSSKLPVIAGAGAIIVTVTALSAMTPLPAATANPTALPVQIAQCGAKKCNPCAAAKCNPCAAAKCNPCNPCNPCAASGATSACVVPRLAANPCAAAKCNPCNPCAAAKCNPCNPCAAAKCNPCSPCNPCNPCAAGEAVEITPEEAVAVYDCLLKDLKSAYAGSGPAAVKTYHLWPRYNTAPYVSGTHGGRHVNNYANPTAKSYGAYEKGGKMAVGGTLAKDSFSVNADGGIAIGPLFLMEKMAAGFNADSGDWKYTMVMPGGAVFGATNGKNSAGMTFCYECHMTAEDQDSMFFLPEEYRAN